MITSKRTTSKDLDTSIRRMGHVDFVIPWVYHFLSRPRSLHYRSKNQRFITVNDTCMRNLELKKEILAKSKDGIDMNLLTFRVPYHTYYSDSCPAELEGYSNQGHTWCFHVPAHLQSSSYGRNTWQQISCIRQMGRVLSLNLMPRYLHGQPQQARAYPFAWIFCNGCQEREIIRLTFNTLVEGTVR